MIALGYALSVAVIAPQAQAATQTAPTAKAEGADATPAAAPVDPARLAAARPVVDQIWPLGTYARIMHATMNTIIKSSLASMYDIKPSDIDPDAEKKAGDDKSIGELATDKDPAFKKRMDITMKVMFDEMAKLMTEIEPQVRVALAHAYARKFSVAQLDDLHRFFATPTGAVYAHDSMTMMMGPDMMQAMKSFTPRLIKQMPEIMKKVEAATKDLPPPAKETKQ
ncbi:hypothetical protein GCM10023219_16890 [Stakelama sediminis]|uniref:DUF2059 domain-containing protein n=1 Tax=Stakelama sediminis TaxID=463200 RepID=A0A840YY14_9SPHN|nr:DUF2059 domain-containing protein [Stakelama sediminis]MBB5718420.1 hypothetical protein [Stakelama sediminis]